jgi:hypothetical protein
MVQFNSKRDKELLSLWRERPIGKRTSEDVMSFYTFLQNNCPELIRSIHGDPYQYLNGLLMDCFSDKP